MDGRRADLDLAIRLTDTREPGNARDVDERRRFTEPQLHQQHEAVTAGEQFAASVFELANRVFDRRGALIVECGRDHALPPWMMRHSFSGRSIMSMCFTPNSLSASTAADTMLGVEPRVPASPTPLAPSGFRGVGVTVAWSAKRGKSVARGRA